MAPSLLYFPLSNEREPYSTLPPTNYQLFMPNLRSGKLYVLQLHSQKLNKYIIMSLKQLFPYFRKV